MKVAGTPKPRRRRFGDFVLDKLAAGLAESREAAELELLAAVCAKPRDGLAAARSAGLTAAVLVRDEVRLCWDAIELLDRRGKFSGDLDHDRAWAFWLICHGYAAEFPALWVPGSFGSVWTREQQWRHLQTSGHWSEALVEVLFDAYPPIVGYVHQWAATVMDIERRGRDAMEHFRRACRLLGGEDVIEEWHRPKFEPVRQRRGEKEVAA